MKKPKAEAAETVETVEPAEIATATAEPATETAPGDGKRHLLAGGAALAAMAFVLGLWLVRGGSLGMLLGDEPAVASSATPREAPAAATPYAPAPRFVAPQPAVPVTPPGVAARAALPMPGAVPVAVAPNGTAVFVAPPGVINPLTMLHDPAYYQQWGRVGLTYVNPFAYQQIMLQMLNHSMQAWGMGAPITVAVGDAGAPNG